LDRQSDPDGSRHWFFDQVDFACAGVSCRFFDRAFLDFGNSGTGCRLVLGAGLVMLVVLMWSIPALHNLLDLLWLKIQILLGLNP